MPDRPDPFTVLGRPAPTVRPRPQFVIALRRRLQEELDMSLTDATGTDAPAAQPDVDHGALGLVHVRVADADRAMAFFSAAFGWVGERYDGDGHVSHYTRNTAVTVRLLDDPAAAAVRPNYHVRHVGDAVQAIESAGGRVSDATVQDDGGGWAYAEDAAGLPFLVYRPGNRYHERSTDLARATVGLVFLVESARDAAPFYGSVLGWDLEPAHAGSRYFDSVPRVGVFDEEAVTGTPVAPSVTLYLDVPDLADAIAEVRRLGGSSEDAPGEPDMGPYFTVRCADDQGTTFGLLSLRRG
jgi:predicted enzyme related to lactoylglutathione lyase